MYVYIYICTYIYIYIRVHVCMYVHMYGCLVLRYAIREVEPLYVCMYVCMYMRMYVCMVLSAPLLQTRRVPAACVCGLGDMCICIYVRMYMGLSQALFRHSLNSIPFLVYLVYGNHDTRIMWFLKHVKV